MEFGAKQTKHPVSGFTSSAGVFVLMVRDWGRKWHPLALLSLERHLCVKATSHRSTLGRGNSPSLCALCDPKIVLSAFFSGVGCALRTLSQACPLTSKNFSLWAPLVEKPYENQPLLFFQPMGLENLFSLCILCTLLSLPSQTLLCTVVLCYNIAKIRFRVTCQNVY